MKFISFGSGSSGNCYYLSTGTDALLIDVGVGIRALKHNFSNYGISFNSIHNILITHDHADHVKSVGSLSSQYNLPVFATHKVHEGIFNNKYIKKKIHEPNINYVEKGKEVKIGDFLVTPFNVPHDSTDNVGYVIKNNGITLSLITDCGHITEEMPEIISDSDYLIIEANHDLKMLENGPYPIYLQNRVKGSYGHLSNGDCAKAIAENASDKLKHIWLCHLSEKNNTPEKARTTVEMALEEEGIGIGEGLKLDVLDRKSPSEIFEL